MSIWIIVLAKDSTSETISKTFNGERVDGVIHWYLKEQIHYSFSGFTKHNLSQQNVTRNKSQVYENIKSIVVWRLLLFVDIVVKGWAKTISKKCFMVRSLFLTPATWK